MSLKYRVTTPPVALRVVISAVSSWCLPVVGQTPVESPFVYHTWQRFSTRDGLPHDGIRAIRILADKVWVGTDGGLALYEDGDWKNWTSRDGLPWGVISAIDIDSRSGNVWLGTWGGGIIRFTGGRFDQFTQFNSGLSGNLVFALVVEGDRVWVATNGGISSFDTLRDTWELYAARRADVRETAVTTLSVSAAGDYLYAAGWGLEVRKFDLAQGEWTTADQPMSAEQGDLADRGLVGGAAIGITAVGRSLWLLTQDQLFRRSETKTWLARGFGTPLEGDNFVSCLAARHETEAWVGTNEGLYVLTDWPTDTWVTYRRCENRDAVLIMATRQGRTVGAIRTSSPVPTDRIRCIAFERDAVWVGTANGLRRGSGRKSWSESARDENALSADKVSHSPRPSEGSAAPRRDPTAALPKAVTIAALGPRTTPIALPGGDARDKSEAGRADLLAVQLAVEEANSRGGYRGSIPFGLVTGTEHYVPYGWATAEDEFATFLCLDGALGVVGYLGPGEVIRSVTAFRSEMPLVNVADSRATIDEQINPWIFRCPGDDPRQHQRLVDYVVEQMGCTRLGLIRTPGVVARRHLDLWGRYAREGRERSRGFVAEVAYDPNAGGLDEALGALAGSGVEAVFTWCDAAVSARILQRMRSLGMSQLLVGSDRIVSDDFVVLAGPNPGLTVAPYPCPHRKDRKALDRFVEIYTEQNSPTGLQRPPTLDAYLTYHATSHLLQAINVAGLDRDAVRRALVKMGDTRLATLNKGHWEPVVLPPR